MFRGCFKKVVPTRKNVGFLTFVGNVEIVRPTGADSEIVGFWCDEITFARAVRLARKYGLKGRFYQPRADPTSSAQSWVRDNSILGSEGAIRRDCSRTVNVPFRDRLSVDNHTQGFVNCVDSALG